MCGVAGIWCRDGRPVAPEELDRLAAPIVHRGPDRTGLHLAGPLALASHRFALEDVPGGAQPARSGPVTVVWNGEIFNWAELARRHALDGVTGDTTLLPRLFEALGAAALPELNGQFALAVHDARDDTLLLARDPAGILPLHWAERGAEVVFSSEYRSFRGQAGRNTPPADGRPDEEALAHFLRMGFFAAPTTPVAAVRQLEPGAAVVFERGRTRPLRFAAPAVTGGFRGDLAAATDAFVELYVAAVRRRLSQSTQCLFLSGGVDSALLAAALVRLGVSLPAFTVGFSGAGELRRYHFAEGFERPQEVFSEFADADETARSLALPLPERVDVPLPVLTRRFAEVVAWLDLPCMSISAPPLFFLTDRAARTARVAHSGGGADELFAGYAHVDPEKYRGAASAVDRYLELVQVFSPAELAALGSPLVAAAEEVRAVLARQAADAARTGAPGVLPFVLAAERLGPLPQNILHKNDRIGMRMPIELRYPFLDREVVAFAESLPEELLASAGEGKLLVKAAAERLGVPPAVTHRKKVRLQAPYATYLADPAVARFFRDVIAHPPEDAPRLYDPRRADEVLFGPGSEAQVWRRPAKILLLATWCLWARATA